MTQGNLRAIVLNKGDSPQVVRRLNFNPTKEHTMWVMTPFGILMPSLIPEKYIEDGLELAVRSRRLRDLLIFRAKYMTPLGAVMSPIYSIEGSDYDYRFDTTREWFGMAMDQMSEDIDYVKFKPETENPEKGYNDPALHKVYDRIWSVVGVLGRPYGETWHEERLNFTRNPEWFEDKWLDRDWRRLWDARRSRERGYRRAKKSIPKQVQYVAKRQPVGAARVLASAGR